MRTSICFVILSLCSIPALAQQPAFEAELAPPVYSTQPVFAFRWVAYGYLYPVGTFANRLPCASVDDVAPIGSYKIAGEWGDASQHAATYRLTFGAPNSGKQFVMSGIFGFTLSELNQPEASVYSAVRLSGGNIAEEVEVEVTPRSSDCFGGLARVLLP
jgi:hypothetical protein